MSTLELKELSHPAGEVLKMAAGKTLDLETQGTVLLPPIPTSKMPTGSVLQVVSYNRTNTENGGFLLTTTGTSMSPTSALALSITPTNTTSKIYVQITVGYYFTHGGALTIYRDSTNLGGASNGFAQLYGAVNSWIPATLQHLDSPNTTSAVTYKVGGRVTSGTLIIGADGDQVNTITLMEVAA